MNLSNALKVVLADSYAMYFKAHGHHWNVTGPGFPYFHDFFGDIYEDVYSAVDPVAENIRKLGDKAPFQMDELIDLGNIVDRTVTNARSMCQDLYDANEVVLRSLNLAFREADNVNEQGIANFLAERIDAHQKHRWMLLSTMEEF